MELAEVCPWMILFRKQILPQLVYRLFSTGYVIYKQNELFNLCKVVFSKLLKRRRQAVEDRCYGTVRFPCFPIPSFAMLQECGQFHSHLEHEKKQ